MGRIFVIVGGLLVLLLSAALIVPPFINWTGYRADFEREASRIMGREVHVRGTANARLLPFPSVTFSDVFVGSKDDGTTLTIDTFSINAELMPFLRGEVLIFDMQVEKPVLKLTLDQQGRIDWVRQDGHSLGNRQVKVEKLTLSNGEILIADGRNGREHQLHDINAVLSARNITGPWQMNGSLKSEGETFSLDISTGEVKPDGSIRVRSRLVPQNVAVTFETDGDLSLQGGLPDYAGNFNLRTPETASKKTANKNENAESAKGDRLADAKSSLLTDLRIQGLFKASDQHFVIDEFRMEQGAADDPYVVNGKAQFDFGENPHFEINADGQQFSFGGGGSEQGSVTVPLKEPLAAFRKFIGNIPVPSMPGSVDLRLPAIVAGGTTIRTVVISAVPEGQGWQVKEFSADFPGRTRVEAQGHLGLGQQFGFDGTLLIASRQPSGLASWLAEDVDASVRQLAGLGVSGKVVLNDRVQKIDDLEIALDDTSLKGSFHRQLPAGGVPSIGLELESKKISTPVLRLLLAPLSSVENITVLGEQAVDVALKADALELEQGETGALDAAFRFSNGRLDFDRFMLQDVNGAIITATGNFKPSDDELAGTVDATVLAEDLAGLIEWLEQFFPDQPLLQTLYKRSAAYPDLLTNSEINFIANTVISKGQKQADDKTETGNSKAQQSSEISFSLNGKAGRMQLDFSGTAGGQWESEEGLQLQLNGSASSGEGEQVLALLGVPVLPLGFVGELSADVALQGALNLGVRTKIQLKAPDAEADFDGVVTVMTDDLTASGKAQVKAADIEPFLASTGYSLPGFGLGLPVQLSSDVQFAKGIVRLPTMQGMIADNQITAKLEALHAENSGPLLRGDVEANTADLQFFGEMMLGSGTFASQKNSWPRQNFVKLPLLPLALDLKVKAGEADIGQYGVIKDFSAAIVKTDDQLNLNEMAGQWKDGSLSGSVQLRNSEGNALFSSDVNWKGSDLAKLYQPFSADDDTDTLHGQTDLNAKLQANGTSILELIKSLSGSAQLNVEGLTITGVNLDSLAEVLNKTDKYEISGKVNAAKEFEALAAEATKGGEFQISHAQFDFTIAGGSARMGLTRLENSKAVMEAELQIDLAAMLLNGSSRFYYKLGDSDDKNAGAPSVNFAITGSYSEPKLQADYQPLVQFLTQRALEREQERVEALQSSLREKQILRRDVERLKAQQEARDKMRLETETRNKAEAKKLAQERLHLQRLQEEAQKSASPDHTLNSVGQSVEEFLKDLEARP